MRAEAARAIVGAGVAVMGHTGLMPQSVSVLGGFGPQGRTADNALLVIQDAIVNRLLRFTPQQNAPCYDSAFVQPSVHACRGCGRQAALRWCWSACRPSSRPL